MSKHRKRKRAASPPKSEAPPQAPEAPAPLLKVLAWGALIINGMTALAVGITLISSTTTAFILCVLLALVTIIGGVGLIGPSALYATLLSFLGIAIGALELPDYLTQISGEVAHDLPVSEIQNCQNTTQFYFKDAVVHQKYKAYFTHIFYTQNTTTKTREKNTVNYAIAPIASQSWDINKEISAWAICSDPNINDCIKLWREDHKSAVRLIENHKEQYDQTKSAFFSRNKRAYLAKDAPYLYWTADPSSYLDSKRWMILGMFIFMNLLWFIVIPAVRFYDYARGAPSAEAHPTPSPPSG